MSDDFTIVFLDRLMTKKKNITHEYMFFACFIAKAINFLYISLIKDYLELAICTFIDRSGS